MLLDYSDTMNSRLLCLHFYVGFAANMFWWIRSRILCSLYPSLSRIRDLVYTGRELQILRSTFCHFNVTCSSFLFFFPDWFIIECQTASLPYYGLNSLSHTSASSPFYPIYIPHQSSPSCSPAKPVYSAQTLSSDRCVIINSYPS